jgi:hypothetical protein
MSDQDQGDRGREAEERASALAALERRVETAERRALEAERRLKELSDEVAASAGRRPKDPMPGEAHRATANEFDAADLRSRLARTAARKKPGSAQDD